MATLKKNQNPTSYTYESVDGSTSTIEVGKDGVTKEMIVLLQQDDNRCYLQDLYQMRHESYKFQNAMAKYCRSGDENAENPFYQVPFNQLKTAGRGQELPAPETAQDFIQLCEDTAGRLIQAQETTPEEEVQRLKDGAALIQW